jgi:hypothetical protein
MAASEVLVTNGATPATPAAGKTKVFVNATKQLAQVNDAGVVETVLRSAAATAQSSPANPTGTTDTAGKMMGLAGSITPTQTGRMMIVVTGNLSNSTAAAGDGAKTQIRYGTGSAPANAAALTGTTAGSLISMLLERATASDPFPFCVAAVVTGLTVGTAYWVDLSLAAITGGTAILTNLSISIVEI